MPKIAYESWSPGPEALSVVEAANEIAADYRRQGYDLTLRQLYYQFVSRDLIPNTDRSYKRLGSIVNRARMAGFMDWSYIVDRTRNLAGVGYHMSIERVIETTADAYSVDHWADQEVYVEVWVEKEALAGVVRRAAGRWNVPHFSCRGYVSQSELWGAGQRLGGKVQEGKRVVVLHLGDHDPSGIDMTRDIKDRLRTFATQDWLDAGLSENEDASQQEAWVDMTEAIGLNFWADEEPIEVRRIALNWDQVQQYNPPPNPAKMTDSRVGGYIERFGSSSWELDALEPSVLNELIQSEIRAEIDHELWAEKAEEQRIGRARLQIVADNWDMIVEQYGTGA